MRKHDRWFLSAFMCCCILVFSTQLLDYYHHSRFLALSVLLVFWSGYILTRRGDLTSPRLTDLNGLSLIVFSGIATLSIIWAPEKSEAIFYAQKWIYASCLYYFMRMLLARPSFAELISFQVKLTRGASLIILGIVTYRLLAIVQTGDLSNEALYALKAPFGHKSLTAAFLFLLIPLNLLTGFKKKINWWVIILIVYQMIIILLIQSRTVYISLALFLLITIGFLYSIRSSWMTTVGKRFIYISLAGLFIAFAVLLQNQGFRDRLNFFNYLKSQTATERQDVWRMTQPLIQEHWLLGVGSGNWKLQFPSHGVEGSYRMQDQNVFFTRAHNDFLEILAELGILGLLAYIMIFAIAFYRLHLVRKRHPWISRMLLAGLLGFLISSLIDFPKERLEFVSIFVLYLFLIDKLAADEKKKSAVSWLIPSAIFILMLGNLYTGVRRYSGERHTARMLEQRNLGNWEKVIQFSTDAENGSHHFDPYSVPIQFYRGVAWYEKGQKEEAKDCFEKAHQLAPYNFHILNNLATVALENKNYVQADQWLEEAIRINPRFEDGLFNLSYSKALQNQFERAVELLDQIPTDSDKKRMFREQIQNLKAQSQ